MAQEKKVEVASFVKAYKESINFRDKVSEVACNAFEEGFEECKRKVSETFNLLDLS